MLLEASGLRDNGDGNHPGAQTERRGGAGPVRSLLGGKDLTDRSPLGKQLAKDQRSQPSPVLGKGPSNTVDNLLVPKEKEVADPAAVLAPLPEKALRIR